MSSRLSLQKPYAVASLPQSIDQAGGRYVVGEVHGGTPRSKKRKRSELVVGVHGESVNLYDVSSSRMITSYALPPQSSFTCAPCSLRTRISRSEVERRTYVSTLGKRSSITLFQESVTSAGSAGSCTTSCELDQSQANVFFLGTIKSQGAEATANTPNLLAIKEDGEIQCLDGKTLQKRWTSPTTALYRDVATPIPTDTKVEFAHLTNAYAASQGILKGRQDVLTAFGQEISEDGFDPDILVMITTSTNSTTSTLHILALPRRASTTSSSKQSVESLLSANLPQLHTSSSSKRIFSVHVSAGILQELAGDVLVTYDLNETLPKVQSRLSIPGSTSFLRLSSTSVIVSSETSIGVYNSRFNSVQATIQLESVIGTEPLPTKRKTGITLEGIPRYELVAYFPKLGTVVALASTDLVAIQLENQHLNKSHASGLLIDSLGRAVQQQERGFERKDKETRGVDLTTLQSYLPGSVGSSELSWAKQILEPEKLYSSQDVEGFEVFMAKKLFIDEGLDTSALKGRVKAGQSTLNGSNGTSNMKARATDRRWVLYALRKIFSWSAGEDGKYRLSISFYPHRVFIWLIQTGKVTVANLESALRNELWSSPEQTIPAGELIRAVVEIDQEMKLLLALLSSNFLGASDLLHAIRLLMQSLELLGDNASTKQKRLTNGEVSEVSNDNVEEELERLEAEAEEDLTLAEYHLGAGSGVRGEALSLALAKLYTCPSINIVSALQMTLAGQEVVSLIYLLRFELARGGWTSRYLDIESDVFDADAEVSSSTVTLISSLLNNCIDAVGAGGWLSGDARLVNGDVYESEDLIKSLKLEVSAALEGIEEATYLKGLTSEFVRYGDAVQNAVPRSPDPDTPAAKKRKTIPIILPSNEHNSTVLPYGLKAEHQISRFRVGAGGELQRRTARDIGQLKSKKVGKYSLERIVI